MYRDAKKQHTNSYFTPFKKQPDKHDIVNDFFKKQSVLYTQDDNYLQQFLRQTH